MCHTILHKYSNWRPQDKYRKIPHIQSTNAFEIILLVFFLLHYTALVVLQAAVAETISWSGSIATSATNTSYYFLPTSPTMRLLYHPFSSKRLSEQPSSEYFFTSQSRRNIFWSKTSILQRPIVKILVASTPRTMFLYNCISCYLFWCLQLCWCSNWHFCIQIFSFSYIYSCLCSY